jgi:hypothetical protein
MLRGGAGCFSVRRRFGQDKHDELVAQPSLYESPQRKSRASFDHFRLTGRHTVSSNSARHHDASEVQMLASRFASCCDMS